MTIIDKKIEKVLELLTPALDINKQGLIPTLDGYKTQTSLRQSIKETLLEDWQEDSKPKRFFIKHILIV